MGPKNHMSKQEIVEKLSRLEADVDYIESIKDKRPEDSSNLLLDVIRRINELKKEIDESWPING